MIPNLELARDTTISILRVNIIKEIQSKDKSKYYYNLYVPLHINSLGKRRSNDIQKYIKYSAVRAWLDS